jgi:hypothetical protein
LRLWLAVLACAAVYAAAGWYLSAPQTFWSPDNAVRFVQLESIRRNGYRSLAAVYPAEDLDPEHGFFPIAEGFSYRRDGRTYLSYPWLFPLLAAPLYGALGFPGLLVLPAAAGLAAAALVGRSVGRVSAAGGVAATLLVGLASPLVVYTAVFWDHTVVAALSTGAVALLLAGGDAGGHSRHGFWAGVLLGLGPHFRNETYVFAVAVAVGLVASGRRSLLPQLLTGFAAAVAPLWAYHLWWFGHPLGYKGKALIEATAAPGLWGYVQHRLLVAYDLFLSAGSYGAAVPKRLTEPALVAAGVLAGAALLRSGVRRGSPAVVGAGGLLVAAVAASPVALRIPVMGLLPSVPWVALALLRQPRAVGIPSRKPCGGCNRGPGSSRRDFGDGAEDRFLWAVAGAYTLGVAAVGSVGGLQWGPRYLLPAVPVLGWLAGRWVAEVWEEPRLRGAVAVTVGCVVAAGLALQVLGLRFVRYSLDSLRAVEDVLQSTRYEVVATGFEPMFRSLGGLYFQKKLMAVDSQEELRSLVRRLAEGKVAGWTYVPRFGRGFNARMVEEWTREGPWRFRVVDDRTPMAVGFAGVGEFGLELRLVTYQGFPAAVPGAGAPPW